MMCRTAIVCLFRYGRIINKTAIDLMERSFFQIFEEKYRHYHEALNKLNTDVSRMGAQRTDLLPGEERKELAKIQKQCMEISSNFMNLVGESAQSFVCTLSISKLLFRTPSSNVYKKIRSFILGNSQRDQESKEEIERKLKSLPVPKPDITRACRFVCFL